MKFVTVTLTESLHYKFKNRCKFYAYTNNDVLTKLISNFVEGKYDEDLGIPSNKQV